MDKKSLSDILRGGNGGDDWIGDDWGSVTPAPDFGQPVPRGQYLTHVIDGALFNAGTGTPGYRVMHEIIEGDFKGRKLWHDVWLSAKAKGQAVRDLAKLGIRSREQLEQPISYRRIRCRVTVVIRAFTGKDGIQTEKNEVRGFVVLGIDPPLPPDAFAPPPADPGPAPSGNAELFPGNGNAATGPYAEGR